MIYDNNVVDVAFKLLILNIVFVEILFKLFYNGVDVAFKSLILNIEFVANAFRFRFVAYKLKSIGMQSLYYEVALIEQFISHL